MSLSCALCTVLVIIYKNDPLPTLRNILRTQKAVQSILIITEWGSDQATGLYPSHVTITQLEGTSCFSMISNLVIETTSLARNHLTSLQISIEHIRFWKNHYRQKAYSGERLTKDEQSFLVTRVVEWNSLSDDFLNDVHNLLQQAASVPDGQPAPNVWRAAALIQCVSKASQTTGWITGGSILECCKAETKHGWGEGCLLLRIFKTVLPSDAWPRCVGLRMNILEHK